MFVCVFIIQENAIITPPNHLRSYAVFRIRSQRLRSLKPRLRILCNKMERTKTSAEQRKLRKHVSIRERIAMGRVLSSDMCCKDNA